jgi:dUTP pyrophosphatase
MLTLCLLTFTGPGAITRVIAKLWGFVSAVTRLRQNNATQLSAAIMARTRRLGSREMSPEQKPESMLGGTTMLGVPTLTMDEFLAEQRNGGRPMRLLVKRHSPKATLPYRATAGSAGYDLCSAEECTLGPGERKVINTDISIEMPIGTYGRVAPRSGLAVKNGINVMAGVLDADYRGKVGVVLVNHGYDTFHFKEGDRIAQLIIEKCSTPVVEEIEQHTVTSRGEHGFGSTGVQAGHSA